MIAASLHLVNHESLCCCEISLILLSALLLLPPPPPRCFVLSDVSDVNARPVLLLPGGTVGNTPLLGPS
jgi:hypothetical protein